MSYLRVFNNEIYTSDISGEIPVITYKDRGREFYNIADNRKWIVKLVNDAPVLHEVLYLKPATENVADIDGSEQVQVLLVDGTYALVPISQIQTYIDPYVAPVVRYYKALITQAGETDPVAHVLNGSDDDFLGDIVWARASGGGSFTGTLEGAFDLVGSQVVVPGLVLTKTSDDVITLTGADGLLTDTYIEIAVRQRNMTAPTIVGIATNELGTKVIIEFSKPMLGYNLDGLIAAMSVTVDAVPNVITSISKLETGEFELTMTDTITSAGVVLFHFDASVDLEGLDMSLVEAIVDEPVTNNVLDFVSAETSEDGTVVMVNFTIAMGNPSELGEAFEVKIDGVAAPHTAVSLGLPTQLIIHMTAPIENGDVVTLSIDAATLESANGTQFAAGLADQEVTNNVPA